MGKRRTLGLLLCLLLLLCTACGGRTQNDTGDLHCTVTIECATVLAHMDDLSPGKAEIVPADGVLLPETAVAFSEGDTVFDVLQRVCRAQGIHMESNWTPAYNSAYIEGIGNLYEFDCGSLSGWMYSVNGVWPDYGCSSCTLHDGDTVVWSYTCDLGRDVHTLSGGQKQMLNLASVVVMRPDVLILDEPTSQLDPIAASTFLHTLRKLNEELGLTILLSEQRLEEAVPLADHLIVLEQGRLLASGAPQEAAAAVRGHAIFSAMPTAARIAAALGAPEHLPRTVREGRAYLRGYAQHPLPEANSAPTQAQPVLRVRDGWLRYAQNAPDVLRGFSLTLRPGELYALTGSNGSGKTTALGVLSGRLRLYRGSVYLGGKKQRALQPLRDGIAAVPQDPRTLFTADTVRADLASLGRDAALLDTVVQQMALAPLLDRHPFDLSGGEQQRAALAKVLLMQPRVLLLDEPTKGMDGAFKADFGALLRTLCAQGTAVCIVSHDVEFCAQYADRCGLLFRGEVVTENDPRAFFSGNYFYTTAAARIARTAAPGAVLCEEVVQCLAD